VSNDCNCGISVTVEQEQPTKVVIVQDVALPVVTLQVEGLQGPKGDKGDDGKNGKDGKDAVIETISTDLINNLF
jgi:hypothetical protein